MCKFIKTIVITIFLAAPFSLNVNAESVVDVNELIEKAKELDGQEVTIQGEAIGERMDRGEYSWININDGTNAIGVWIAKSEAEKITFYGNNKNKGDTVIITGVFNRACKEHGGEADLHTNAIKIVENGYTIKEQISTAKLVTAIMLAILAFMMTVFYYKIIKPKQLKITTE